MAKFLGRLMAVGFKKEGTRGTGETTPAFFARLASPATLAQTPEKIIDESSVGHISGAVGDVIGTKRSEISLEPLVGEDTFGHILLMIYGGVTSVANGDGTYTHTFALANNSTHPSYTTFGYDPVQSYKFPLSVLARAEISAQIGSQVRASLSLEANSAVEATVTPAYTSEVIYLPQHLSFKFAANQAALDAASAICVRSVKLQFDKGIIKDQCMGSQEYSDILNGIFKVSGTVQVSYTAKDHTDAMKGDTVKALRLSGTNAGKVIGSGSRNPAFNIDLYHVKIQSANISYQNGDLTIQDIEFNAYLSIADTAVSIAKLTNTVASY